MPIYNLKLPKCELCGYSLPLDAATCPKCGANLKLIDMIKEIPSPLYASVRTAAPARVMQPEADKPKALPLGVLSSPKEPTVPARETNPEGNKANAVLGVVPIRKPPAAPARVLRPEGNSKNAVPQGLPMRRPPSAPARVTEPASGRMNAVPRAAAAPTPSPAQAVVSIPVKTTKRDSGGLKLPQMESPVARKKSVFQLFARAVVSVGSGIKTFVVRVAAAPIPGSHQKQGFHGFLKNWVLPTMVIAAVYFLFMEFVARNYQARAVGTESPDPQTTVAALGERLSLAEATIAAQQGTILSLQNTISAGQSPTIVPATVPPDPFESKTLLLGPLDGGLVQNNDGLIKTFWAGQYSKNFLFNVVLLNPYSAAYHPWDACVRFRRNYADEYRLTIFSTSQWVLTYGTSIEPIASGTLSNLKTGASESNTLSLEVRDGIASLTVNDVLLPVMDVSAYQDAGDIGFAIGCRKGNEVDGNTTYFQAFTLWNIP